MSLKNTSIEARALIVYFIVIPNVNRNAVRSCTGVSYIVTHTKSIFMKTHMLPRKHHHRIRIHFRIFCITHGHNKFYNDIFN